MSTVTSSTITPLTRPRLRLVHGASVRCGGHDIRRGDGEPEQTAVSERVDHVLIAGSDTAKRSRMLDELRGLLPASTPFLEAGETWEVLARATASRMVVLTSDLGDVSIDSLVRLLSRRYPTLPVVAVDGPAIRAPAPGDVGVAIV